MEEEKAAFRQGVVRNHLVAPEDAIEPLTGLSLVPTSGSGRKSFLLSAREIERIKTEFPSAADWFELDDLLSPEEVSIRYITRRFAETVLRPVANKAYEIAEFPRTVLPEFAKLGMGGGFIQGDGCAGLTFMGQAIVAMEIARVDASFATFWMIHNSIAMQSIADLGSPAQRAKYLPSMASMKWGGAFALTEPEVGSDAANLKTTARQRPDGSWVINGSKRWIGNGTWAHVIVVWAAAPDLPGRPILGFIVERGTPGLTTTKIENKISLRTVENADIVLDNVVVGDDARLPKANSFSTGPGAVLRMSRVIVGVLPGAVAAGAYDEVHKYISNRTQFGAPISSFQMVQHKLVRIMAIATSSSLLAWRLCRRFEDGTMTGGQSALVKAATTASGREAVSIAREMLGGNGIVTDFGVARAFTDMEALYTYEGSYDINVLVAGRELTGKAAFAPPPQARRRR